MQRRIVLGNFFENQVRTIDKRLVSYNIEMTEITGGTFWKEYTPNQVAGTEDFKFSGDFSDFTAISDLMQYYPPINLYDKKLRKMAKALGSCWIRVSGSWATKTYYDFEGKTAGKAPIGYQSVLSKEQWIGVLDFVKAVGGKLLISVSNCEGDHPQGGVLDLTQTKKIFDFSHNYGVDIDAVEFMNEPNMLEFSGAPKGYTEKDYVRDHDVFNGWVRKNYPNCLIVGPCTTGDPLVTSSTKGFGAGIGSLIKSCTTDELMNSAKEKLDVFSYHYYNGVSERLSSVMPSAHWSDKEAVTDDYLSVAPDYAKKHLELRDKYVPGGQIWVTESGDAGGGGNTWASTYLDVFRTLNELGSFASITDGVIFHNTLASSDYGFLEHGTFRPRPNYFAVLLWNKLMGNKVYDCSDYKINKTHVYCHSRRDGKEGRVYLIINNSKNEKLSVEIKGRAEYYTLSADDLRISVLKLNGKELSADNLDNWDFAVRSAVDDVILLLPLTCTFVVM